MLGQFDILDRYSIEPKWQVDISGYYHLRTFVASGRLCSNATLAAWCPRVCPYPSKGDRLRDKGTICGVRTQQGICSQDPFYASPIKSSLPFRLYILSITEAALLVIL